MARVCWSQQQARALPATLPTRVLTSLQGDPSGGAQLTSAAASISRRGNETVSHVLAKDTDVWFHLRGLPGAHVILRVPPGKQAPDEDMQFAADLAAFFSKERDAAKAAVSYTSPKHVRLCLTLRCVAGRRLLPLLPLLCCCFAAQMFVRARWG